MKGMGKKNDPPRSAESNGQRRSDEFERFESLTKRLLRVPKKEISGQPARSSKKARPQ